jgi:hypothetical protein
MCILAIGCVCNRQIREWVHADVSKAEMLEFWSSAVVVNGERTLGEQSDGLSDRRLTQATK